MQRKTLFLTLTIVGAVAPMIAFLPWIAAHGLDLRLLLAQLFANRITTFFAIDLLITGCVVAVFARLERVQPRWLVILVLLCVGVSAALPLLLFLRERARSAGAAAA